MRLILNRKLYVLLGFLITPIFSLAQNTGTTGGSDYTGVTGGNSGISLQNPLGNVDLIEFLQMILDVIMVFAVPLIVFMIIYAGFLFVMDRGSEKNLSKAKNALLYALIGGVLIIGANALLLVIQGTVDAFRN